MGTDSNEDVATWRERHRLESHCQELGERHGEDPPSAPRRSQRCLHGDSRLPASELCEYIRVL